MKTKPEKLSSKTELRFKVCLWCGHIQHAEYGFCEKCHAGAIGLGKPREMWAYLDLKIEGVLSLPEALKVVVGYRDELAKRQVEANLYPQKKVSKSEISEKFPGVAEQVEG